MTSWFNGARHRPVWRRAAVALALMAATVAGNASAAELIMVRQRGCAWCALWDREIGPIYPLSEEGRFAPLRPVDLGEPLPAYIEKPATITPTFILVEDNHEIDRIVGYLGDGFFWELLADMLNKTSFRRTPPS